MSHHEYPAPEREITTDDLAAFLIPDSPAPIDKRPVPSTAELLAAWEREQQRQLDVPAPAPEVPANAEPIVPRWVWKVSARTAIAAAVAGVVAFAVWGLAVALAAAAAALAAAAPYLAGALVLVVAAALLCRRGSAGAVEVTQTVTQTITQSVKVGRR